MLGNLVYDFIVELFGRHDDIRWTWMFDFIVYWSWQYKSTFWWSWVMYLLIDAEMFAHVAEFSWPIRTTTWGYFIYIYSIYSGLPTRKGISNWSVFKHQWPTFETDMLGLRDADVLWTLEGTDQHRWNQTESHVQKTRTPSFWQIHRKWICWHIWDHFWEELDTCDMWVRTKNTKNKTPCGEQFFVQTISRTVQQFATIEGNPIHSHMFFWVIVATSV